MKTQYKYISYREDRKCYIVSIKYSNSKKQATKTCKTLEDALQQRTMLMRLLRLDESILNTTYSSQTDSIPTLKEAFTLYVETEVRQRVALSTYSKYNLCMRTYCYFLGSMRIDKITKEMWQDVFTAVQSSRNLSSQYIVDDFRRYRAMYEYYIERNIITDNPLAKKLKLHRTHRIRRRAFTEQEKAQFLRSAREYNEKYFILFSLYFETGARRGEILALQWQDVDFCNKMILIQRNIERGTIEGKFIEQIGQVKTAGSVRYVPISDAMCDMLKSLHNEANLPTDYVFTPNRRVKYPFISLGNVERAYTKIRNTAKLDKCLTIHCIRHYVASKLLNAGVDVATVQAIGGWSSPTVLLSVYAHSSVDTTRKALESVIFNN